MVHVFFCSFCIPSSRITLEFEIPLFTGKDLIAAKKLLNRHQVILADIASHEPRIRGISEMGNKMVEEGMQSSYWVREIISMSVLREQICRLLELRGNLKISDPFSYPMWKVSLNSSIRFIYSVVCIGILLHHETVYFQQNQNVKNKIFYPTHQYTPLQMLWNSESKL